MNTKRIAALSALALGMLPVAEAAPNLVQNGSMNYTGSTLTSWTLLDPTGESWNTFDPGNASADGGSYFGIQDLDAFAPRHNAIGISQPIAGLVPGAAYTLSFYSNEEHTNPNFLAQWKVTFGTETAFSTPTDTTWFQDIVHFTASSASQTLTFIATFLPGAFPQILNVDGVRLEASPVPLPAAVWVFAPALAGLLGAARRRAKGADTRVR